MTLSDRLRAAARQRGEEPGPTEPAPMPAPAAPAAPRSVLTDIADEAPRIRIISPAAHPASTVTPDPAASPAAICPSCCRTGELGVMDLVGRTAHWSCGSCGTLWQVSLPGE